MAKAALGSIPLLIHPWGWAWAMLRSGDDGTASLWVQAGTLYTWYSFFFFFYCSGFCHTLKWNSHGFTCGEHMYTRYSMRAICLLPGLQWVLIAHTKTLEEQPFLSAILLQKGLGLLLSLYKCLIIHSCHRLTGAAIFLPAVGTDFRRVVISQWAATAMAISRPHCNLKMLFSTELKKKSPRNYFCELYWSVGFLDNSQ